MKIVSQAEYDAVKAKLHSMPLHTNELLLASMEIEKQLLEYRRQNKIYEVGDWVVSTLYGSGDNVFQFESWLVDFMDCIRHANDAEIEANRRLDLLESVVKSLGEVP